MKTTDRPELFKARRDLNLTQAQLASALGLADANTLARYERGAQRPPKTFLAALALYLERADLEPEQYALTRPPLHGNTPKTFLGSVNLHNARAPKDSTGDNCPALAEHHKSKV